MAKRNHPSDPPISRREFDHACDAGAVDAADRGALWDLYRRWPVRKEERPGWLPELLRDYQHWRTYRRSRAGDEEAAREFERTWRAAIRTGRGRLFAPAEAEELTACFFERVYRHIGESFAWRSPFSVYLRTVLVNLARTQGRRTTARRRRESSLDPDAGQDPALSAPDPSPEQALLDQERRLAIDRALEALPPLDRHVVRQLLAEGRKAEEVALELGISREAVYKRSQRARKRLRAALCEQGLVSDRGRSRSYPRRTGS